MKHNYEEPKGKFHPYQARPLRAVRCAVSPHQRSRAHRGRATRDQSATLQVRLTGGRLVFAPCDDDFSVRSGGLCVGGRQSVCVCVKGVRARRGERASDWSLGGAVSKVHAFIAGECVSRDGRR